MVTPQLTVLMPVYNAERFLRPAIDSILAQTFSNFEFLIIDDGSTDSTATIVESYRDPRIRFVKNSANAGITPVLNQGIGLAACELIARMDADDIADPKRLQKQFDHMQANPDCALLSTWAKVVSHEGKFVRLERYPSRFYYYNLTFECWMYHPTIMFKKSAVQSIGMYAMAYSEDYDLFWRMSTRFKIDNIAEALVDYRLSPTSLNLVAKKSEYEVANEANVIRNLRFYLGDDFEISKPALECLRHNFNPIVETNNVDAAIEALEILMRITNRILERKNPNRNEEAIKSAYFFKREFIIKNLLIRLPLLRSSLLLLHARDWVVMGSLCKAFLKKQITKIKTLSM